MTMEKYGADPTTIPPSDDQLREIKKMAKEKDMPVEKLGAVDTYDQANQVIEQLRGK